MKQKVIVLAPHTDDGELGCGATISKFLRIGMEVFYVAFSICEDSLPKDREKNTLKIELLNAMTCIGIPRENIIIFNYKVRLFSENRQSILEDMIKLNNTLKPDLVLMPSINDIHQDHYTVANEGLRAFKKTSILCYEVPWNNYRFNNQTFSIVSEEDIIKKIDAIKCYESQKHRDYTKQDYIMSLSKIHGVQIGADYAEVFEVPRWIL